VPPRSSRAPPHPLRYATGWTHRANSDVMTFRFVRGVVQHPTGPAPPTGIGAAPKSLLPR